MKRLFGLLATLLFAVLLSACSGESEKIQQLEAENAMLKDRLDSVGKAAIQLVDQAEQARIQADLAAKEARNAAIEAEAARKKAEANKK